MTATVTQLRDHGHIPCADPVDIGQWLHDWTDGLASGDYGDLKTVVIVVQMQDGSMATISQSLGSLNGIELIGLLTASAHRHADGRGNIDDLKR